MLCKNFIVTVNRLRIIMILKNVFPKGNTGHLLGGKKIRSVMSFGNFFKCLRDRKSRLNSRLIHTIMFGKLCFPLFS
jgi:hypothetical protein